MRVFTAAIVALLLVPAGVAATITGTSGSDTVWGTGQGDDIHAGAGEDAVNGRGGNDVIRGNSGDDNLRGGAGNDILSGGPGHDTMYGLAGDDVLNAQGGNEYNSSGNYLEGGRGDDIFHTDNPYYENGVFIGWGDDIIHCGAGYDRVYGDSADESKAMTWQQSGCEWLKMDGVVYVFAPPPTP